MENVKLLLEGQVIRTSEVILVLRVAAGLLLTLVPLSRHLLRIPCVLTVCQVLGLQNE